MHPMRESMFFRKQEQVVKTAIDARGAERGPTTRNVLVLSTSLTVMALVAVYAVFIAD
jgi:hypothetical protein